MLAPVRAIVPVLLTLFLTSGVAGQQLGAPETFTANVHATGAQGGAAAATIQIEVRRYTPEADRGAVQAALKTGGYPAFLSALRKAPEVGAVSFGDRKWSIRYARERRNGTHARSIVVVTDQPIFFVGGGSADAKPRAGFEVALLEFQIDDAGLGNGSMTAAARVKPGGDGDVVVEDYAANPMKLVTVTRKIQ